MIVTNIQTTKDMRNYRELSKAELSELEQLYPITVNRVLAKKYDISLDALIDYVAKPRGWKKDRSKIFIGSRGGRSLKDSEVNWIIRNYQRTKNADIMEKFNIGEATLHRIARKYGLKKSKQQMKKMQTMATEAAWLACKRYGVYKQTAERMRETMNEMYARGECIPGSFQKGVSNRERLGTRRFNQSIKKGQEKRKESIRIDRLRIRWGLPQKTKMKILYDGFDAKAKKRCVHRHLFRKAGYIVERGSNDVYYDEETKRRPKMEANAKMWGFKVTPWNEELRMKNDE